VIDGDLRIAARWPGIERVLRPVSKAFPAENGLFSDEANEMLVPVTEFYVSLTIFEKL